MSSATADSLKSDQDRANILVLKAKQLQLASRTELPAMIAELGIEAPEVMQMQAQINALEKQRSQLLDPGGLDSDKAEDLDAELDKLRFRLELASEGVRQRVIEEGRAATAKLQAPPPEESGTAVPKGLGPAPPEEDRTP